MTKGPSCGCTFYNIKLQKGSIITIPYVLFLAVSNRTAPSG